MKWEWADDGVKIGDILHKLVKVTPKELEEFRSEMNVAGEVYATLKLARMAFIEGRASYLGAGENLKALLAELSAAQAEAVLVTEEVGAFFEPPIQVAAALGKESVETLLRFAVEALGRFGGVTNG
jgi:hypothetical protein